MLCFLALPGDFKEATLQYTVDPESCQLKCFIVSLAKHQPSTEIYGCYVTVFLRKICLQFCFIWVLRDVSIDLLILLLKCTRLMLLTSIFKKYVPGGA